MQYSKHSKTNWMTDNAKELTDFRLKNLLVLYSWIILKCCQTVVTSTYQQAKSQCLCGFPALCLLFKLLGGEIYLAVSWYTFICFILHIHLILHFCASHLKFLEPKWSQINYAKTIETTKIKKATISKYTAQLKNLYFLLTISEL